VPKELKEIKETTEVVKFDIENAIIVALDKKYKDIQITDAESREFVRQGRKVYRDLRLKVVDGHKDEKDDALKHCQFLDAEKRRILARLAPGENHLDEVWQADKDRIAKIKEDKARLEEERKETIRAEIFKIQESAMPTVLGTMALENLRELSGRLEDMEIKEDEFMEFTGEAEKTLNDAYEAVQRAITARIKSDKEDADRKAEDERLEKIRKKQAAAQAKIDEENRKIKDEKDKIEADRKAEDDRKAKEAFEKEVKEKAEAAAAQKLKDAATAEEERAKTAAAEEARKEALRPDREKLIAYAHYLQKGLHYPELQSKKSKQILKSVRIQIYDIGNEILEALEEL